jgi:hypothetical protein
MVDHQKSDEHIQYHISERRNGAGGTANNQATATRAGWMSAYEHNKTSLIGTKLVECQCSM